ncbi:hypothetical protein JWG41_16240 [Leptospira sp. 201903075]|uniref:hypothetical protein n=1 Tax=Leptospira chreensis TaxID=2810035 RepID=UPI001964D25C|nr:hypothetical protein [Leptospira chreensis]MBM9591781.1 hypothetical protein [Leptospira chreensis]MBM9591999.1 hypothetical protein [Leptospira chreensis]
MAIRIFLLTIVGFFCTHCTSLDLAGKSYEGKPKESAQKPRIIGAVQAGRIDFAPEKVTYILPGSDLKNIGTYTVSAGTVTIRNATGVTYTFTIKEDGKILLWNGVELRRTDFSWP